VLEYNEDPTYLRDLLIYQLTVEAKQRVVSWRLLASIQAANGTIMFGWTTAIVMAVIHRMAIERVAEAA